MGKTITLSQGDLGINFEVRLTDNKKKPIKLNDDDVVTAYIVCPDNTDDAVTTDNITITNKNEGIVRVELEKKHTEEAGSYSIFIEVSSPIYKITAKKAIYYYVMEKHGGIKCQH